MSVHSLIDRFDQQSSGGVGTLAAAAAAAAAEESAAKTASETEENPSKSPLFKPKLQPLASEPLLLSVRSLASSPKRTESPKQSRGSLASILGPELSDFPYSEGALVEAIRLRIEQEKTQQEAFRREVASKNFDILQTALRAQVPVHLIPQMCVSSSLIAEQHQIQQLQSMYGSSGQQYVHPHHQQQRLLLSQTSSQASVQLPHHQTQVQAQAQLHAQSQPMQYPYQHQPLSSFSQGYGPQFISPGTQQPPSTGLLPPGHYSGGERNARVYPVASLARPDTLSASSVPPLNYRFGGPSVPATSSMSSPSYPSTRRPLSPAKIGAQAVANLNMPTTPSKRSATNLYQHQRHYSMPVDTSSTEIPLSHSALAQAMNIGTPQKGTKSGSKRSQGPPSPSLSGTTARIQVNPLPAQPLHKQKKLGQPPSQESMTSLSHIIQFHHWKPENPGVGSVPTGTVMGGPQSLSVPGRGHKRHKLESMSIDAGSHAPSKLTTPEENASDHDLTLDDDTDTSRLAEPPTQPQSH